MSEPYQHRIGTRLRNKWLIERLLGAGGMAAVYEGVNAIGRRVAIKVLHPEVANDPDQRERFELEGRAVNQIQHPGVIEIVDIDTTEDGLPFLVMELLEGQTLQDLVDQGRPPTVEALLQLVDQLLDVLAAAHAVGIIHRDLKPDNLFVLPDGRLKVLDFGIARVRNEAPQGRAPTQTGTIIGTAAFMAPEQIRGVRDLDPRADLYSVGATIFRVLANRHVHIAEGQFELLLKASSTPAPPLRTAAPHVPESVAMVVDRALTFERDQRYPDARTMQGDVRALLQNAPPPYAIAQLATASHAFPAASGGTPTIHGVTAPGVAPATIYGYSLPITQNGGQPLGYGESGKSDRKSPPIPLLILGGVLMLSFAVLLVTTLRKASQPDGPTDAMTPAETASAEQPTPPESSTATAAATNTDAPPTPTAPPATPATPTTTATPTTPTPIAATPPVAKSLPSSLTSTGQDKKAKAKPKGKKGKK